MVDTLSQIIAKHQVAPGTLAAWWLGSSGYAFKSPDGVVVYLDPYLSDAAERVFGLQRMASSPVTTSDAKFDLYLCSHFHEDHLDPDAVAQLAANNPEAKLAMPPTARSRAAWLGVPMDRIEPIVVGDRINVGDVTVTAVPARHEAGIPGWETPDAVGFLVETGEISVYHSGDTEYDLRLRSLGKTKLAASILCINGAGGNMDAHEAALLGWQIGSEVLIPHHHETWSAQREVTEDTAAQFVTTYHNLGGTGEVLLPKIGELITLPHGTQA